MKTGLSNIKSLSITVLVAVALLACDQMEKVASGVGSGAKSTAGSASGNNGASASSRSGGDAQQQPDSVDETEQETRPAVEVAAAELTKVRLNAFTDFDCSSNWANRDGGWGLVAGSGSGRCAAAFPGGTGTYRVTLMAQLEFDGSPEFKIAVDGEVIATGAYPPSKGEVICDCPNWRVNCPDRVVPIDGGVHTINAGSNIEFFASEVYPCGGKHGAYAKWHELVFTPE